MRSLPREKIQIATKFGLAWINGQVGVVGTPEFVREACEDSLQRLGVDYIDLYFQHRVDSSVPIEVTVCRLTIFISLCDTLLRLILATNVCLRVAIEKVRRLRTPFLIAQLTQLCSSVRFRVFYCGGPFLIHTLLFFSLVF